MIAQRNGCTIPRRGQFIFAVANVLKRLECRPGGLQICIRRKLGSFG